MKKIKTEKIQLKDIKHLENSRLRGQDDVGELMQDIKHRGLLQNIGIREKDNVLMYGNRRVGAYKKLGFKEINADFYEDINDEEILITNVVENIKRKNIGSIEIGRMCRMLQDKNWTNTEISENLKITRSRVDSAVSAYNVTLGTPFEKLVIFGNKGKHKGIPESLIWKIQNSVSRARKLSKEDWTHLLRALETGELTAEYISQLRNVLMSSPDLGIIEALDILKKCRIVHLWLHLDYKKLGQLMKRDKFSNEVNFIKHIIREYDKELLF